MKADIYPLKGQFRPGEPVIMRLECSGYSADHVRISIYLLGRIVQEIEQAMTGGVTDIVLTLPDITFAGFGVKAVLYSYEAPLVARYTAFDIGTPGSVVRYGFLSDFGESAADEADVCAMAKYHVNAVQFYDWSFRPDELVAHEEIYHDLMGKENRLSVVKKKVAQCHAHGMRAVGYGAVYAASEAYRSAHPDESLFARADEPICFIGRFYIMDIRRGGAWHGHIIGQYREAVKRIGFDGIHMDTYGFPKAALSASGEAVYLDEHFNALIEDTREALSSETDHPCLIFNNVGGWPVEKTKYAPQECVYIEVWPPCDRYIHLKQLILDAKTSGKPVVLAAYPVPFRTDTPERALESELLCALAIGLNGATQLFVGEHHAVITQGYYADYTRLNEAQIGRIRTVQDFMVQYEALLLDDTLIDVSMTHMGWDNTEYACGAPCSVSAEADRLWLIIRENKERKLIGIVNLCGNGDLWNEGKNTSCALHDICFSIQTLQPPKHILYASPDENGGIAAELPYGIEQTDRGEIVHVSIPYILHGGLLWVEV